MKNLFNAGLVGFLPSLLLVLVGCTRPEANQAKIAISLPAEKAFATKALSAQSIGVLTHVIINVRGNGISAPIALSYDIEDNKSNTSGSSTPTGLPTTYSIDVPSGSARLIQVLAVYMDPLSKIGDFTYGEVTKDLSSGENTIEIPVLSVGTGKLDGGKVAGRYIAKDGSFPTGALEIRLRPPTASASLVIERGFMMNGWFSQLALDSVPFDLVLVPQEIPVLEKYTLSSFTFNDDKKVKIMVPNYVQYHGDGSSSQHSSSTTVLGLFGPGVVAANKVCYTKTSYSYSNLKTASGTTGLLWNSSSTNSSDVVAQAHSSVSDCTAVEQSSLYSTILPFNPEILDSWGGEEAVQGFVGIFRFPVSLSNGSSPVQLVVDQINNKMVSKFTVLPGTSSVVDSVGVYFRPLKSPEDYYGKSGPRCADIAKGGLGFRFLGSSPLIAGTLDYADVRPLPTDLTEESVVAYCPLKGGQSLGGGMAVDHIPIDKGGGVTGDPPQEANAFKIESNFGKMGQGQCHRLRLQLLNNSQTFDNFYVKNSQSLQFALGVEPAPSPLFSLYGNEVDCKNQGTAISSLNIPVGATAKEFWVRTSANSTGSGYVVANLSSGTLSISSLSLSLVVAYSNLTASKLVSFPSDLKMGGNECREIEVFQMDANDVPRPFSSTALLWEKLDNLGIGVADTSFQFYAACGSTTAPQTSIPTGALSARLAIQTQATPPVDRLVKITATGLSVQIPLNAPQPSSAFSTLNPTMSTVPADGTSATTITLTLKDMNGKPLTGKPVYFLVSGSMNAITPSNGISTTDSAGQASITLSTSYAETKTITAKTDGGFTLTTSVTFNATANGPATKLFLQGPTSTIPWDCNAYSVIAQNSAGTATNVTADTIITLSGQGSGTFYSDSACTNPVANSITIKNSTASEIFYYKNTTAQYQTLIASAVSLAQASQPVQSLMLCESFLPTVGTGSWLVPTVWNNAANVIELIGGGGGGAAGVSTAGGGGGASGSYGYGIQPTSSWGGAGDAGKGGAGGTSGTAGGAGSHWGGKGPGGGGSGGLMSGGTGSPGMSGGNYGAGGGGGAKGAIGGAGASGLIRIRFATTGSTCI